MKKPPNINIIIVLVLAIILFDIYYQLVKTSGSLFETGWVINRVLILSAFVLVIIIYFAVNKLLGSKRKQELFSRQFIYSQEQSRRNIASELHDGLGQNLVLVKNRILQILSSNGSGPRSKDLRELSGLVTNTIEEVKRISYNLYPHQIEKLGLTSALNSLLNSVAAASGIKFDYEVHNIDSMLSKENEINFFRIIQEAVGNLVKHSRALKARVQIGKTPGLITVLVADNGTGFNAGRIFEGAGLSSIYERARILKGSLKIDSAPGKGTTITLYLPVSAKD